MVGYTDSSGLQRSTVIGSFKFFLWAVGVQAPDSRVDVTFPFACAMAGELSE